MDLRLNLPSIEVDTNVLNAIGGSVIFGSLLTTPFSLILMTFTYRRLRGTESHL